MSLLLISYLLFLQKSWMEELEGVILKMCSDIKEEDLWMRVDSETQNTSASLSIVPCSRNCLMELTTTKCDGLVAMSKCEVVGPHSLISRRGMAWQ